MMPGLITEQPFLQVERTRRLPKVGLQCRGEIDLATVERLRRALTVAISAGSQTVEVDLREVSFLDSSALRALLAAHYRLARTGRRLCVNASPYSAKLFRLTRMDHLFEIRANEPRANNARPWNRFARSLESMAPPSGRSAAAAGSWDLHHPAVSRSSASRRCR